MSTLIKLIICMYNVCVCVCVCVFYAIFIAVHSFFSVIVRNTLKGCQTEEGQNETVEVEKLSYAADAMQSVAESFRNLTLREITSDFRPTVSGTSKCISYPVILFLNCCYTANITWDKITLVQICSKYYKSIMFLLIITSTGQDAGIFRKRRGGQSKYI